MRSVAMFVVSAVLMASGTVRADERIDVDLLLGSTSATNEGAALRFDRGRTYQATFAWRMWTQDRWALSLEVPFIATPSFDVASGVGQLPKEYASLYLTPGVRVAYRLHEPVSVFGAVGGGYARYSESKTHLDGSPNPGQQDTNTGALEFGGGVDVRAVKWIGFRGEARDVYTGARNFSVATAGTKVHNVVVSGGLVLHF